MPILSAFLGAALANLVWHGGPVLYRYLRERQLLATLRFYQGRSLPVVRRAGTQLAGSNRCRLAAIRRGRCLHNQNHTGDHLFPADLGLPVDA